MLRKKKTWKVTKKCAFSTRSGRKKFKLELRSSMVNSCEDKPTA